ncbi:hypothetical protein B296_00048569, partial [Ensete ventricosum]
GHCVGSDRSVPSDSGTADALVAMRSIFNVDSTVTTRRLIEIPAASRDRGVPRMVEDFSSLEGAQLVAVSGGFLVGVLWVSFSTEWTSQTVNSSVPVLSANETELVEIFWGILSISRVKDMNEAWLAEAGLSLAPRVCFFPFLYQARVFHNRTFYCAEMFNLSKMKSDDGAGSGSVAPSAASTPAAGDVGASTIEKRPSSMRGLV